MLMNVGAVGATVGFCVCCYCDCGGFVFVLYVFVNCVGVVCVDDDIVLCVWC